MEIDSPNTAKLEAQPSKTCEENSYKSGHGLKSTFEHLSNAEEALTYFWSTSANNYLLEQAFPELDDACIKRMQEGSEYVDTLKFQTEEFSYVHTMSSDVHSPEEAKKKMEEYIEDLYERAKRNSDDPQRHCFLRGAALHPIMDSTSPCHKGVQKWNPLNPLHVLKHNSIKENVDGVIGHDVSLFPSIEDLNALKARPEVLKDTIDKMRKADQENFMAE